MVLQSFGAEPRDKVVDEALSRVAEKVWKIRLLPDVSCKVYKLQKIGGVAHFSTVHMCVPELQVAGPATRLRGALAIDSCSSVMDFLNGKTDRFKVDLRIYERTKASLGRKTLADVAQKLEEQAQRVFGRSFAKLDTTRQALLASALEGALAYPSTPAEWDLAKSWLSKLFEGTPSIVKVMKGGFNKERAGKNIRQSDRGEDPG
jgi:hypothetical protein